MNHILVALLASTVLVGCAATDLQREETLSRYDRLEDGRRRLVPLREFADPESLARVETVYMERAAVSAGVQRDSGVDAERFERIVGSLSRTMCRRLARGGFTVSTDRDAASHEVRLTITGFESTNALTAGASSLIGLAVPGPLGPRIPVGIGALAVEGEMLDGEGEQVAAMQWSSRNHIASGGGTLTLLRGDFGETSDGEGLASVFADSFGDLIVETRNAAGGPRGETERGICTDFYGAYENEAEVDTPAN